MTPRLQMQCDAFIQNRDAVKKAFKMEYSAIYPICANIFCARGKNVDPEALSSCRSLLKQKTGIFSNFRGTLTAPLCSMLAAGGAPEIKLEQAIENYSVLKGQFMGSQYLALVAFLLADLGVSTQTETLAERGRAIYQRMKEQHPFLTSGEDSVLAVLMAFSDRSDDELIEDMEACYQLLKKRFYSSNAIQSVSHILALAPGLPQEKVDRMLSLLDGLAAAGGKYGKNYELSALAALSILEGPVEAFVSEMMEVDAFLSKQKGYGFLSFDRKTRMMHAAMLTGCLHQPDSTGAALSDRAAQTATRNAPLTATLAMIAAQQAAMCAIIVSTSTNHAAASSH
ncbi:MAG: DUF4003 family protein [Oscillospiraceae bacterium]|nr:DUF4003 family protein [Oscillospiraceae bacterium]